METKDVLTNHVDDFVVFIILPEKVKITMGWIKKESVRLLLNFSAEKLPDRCPDCGAVAHDNKKAVRPASKTEIEELLKIQKEDKEDTQNEST